VPVGDMDAGNSLTGEMATIPETSRQPACLKSRLEGRVELGERNVALGILPKAAFVTLPTPCCHLTVAQLELSLL